MLNVPNMMLSNFSQSISSEASLRSISTELDGGFNHSGLISPIGQLNCSLTLSRTALTIWLVNVCPNRPISVSFVSQSMYSMRFLMLFY